VPIFSRSLGQASGPRGRKQWDAIGVRRLSRSSTTASTPARSGRPLRFTSPFYGGARPNARFELLCRLAGLRQKRSPETGKEESWKLKDLRKTCATYYDEHVPESSVEILGHAVGGITYRHYAHRAPLAFRAIMTLPQPSAFRSLIDNGDERCPCCQRRFDDAG